MVTLANHILELCYFQIISVYKIKSFKLILSIYRILFPLIISSFHYLLYPDKKFGSVVKSIFFCISKTGELRKIRKHHKDENVEKYKIAKNTNFVD